MSIKVTNWVWARSESRNGARLVMLALADRADDEGRAWPSVEDLCERTRLSRRAVQKGIAELVRIGELKVEQGGGRHQRNRYRIIPKLRTSDAVTHQEPRTSDAVSPKKQRTLVPETANFATETANFEHENSVDSAPEPPLEPPTEPSTEPTPLPPAQPLADRMRDAWWEKYGRTTAQSKRDVRRAIATALENGNPPNEVWAACQTLGDLSKPITGGTLQFAFAELRKPSNVIALPTGQPRPSTTDQRVQAAIEMGRRMQAKANAARAGTQGAPATHLEEQ